MRENEMNFMSGTSPKNTSSEEVLNALPLIIEMVRGMLRSCPPPKIGDKKFDPDGKLRNQIEEILLLIKKHDAVVEKSVTESSKSVLGNKSPRLTPSKVTLQGLKDAERGENLYGPFKTVAEVMEALNA